MLAKVVDERLQRPVLTPGLVPKLSGQPAMTPRLAGAVGAETEEILAAIAEWPERSA